METRNRDPFSASLDVAQAGWIDSGRFGEARLCEPNSVAESSDDVFKVHGHLCLWDR